MSVKYKRDIDLIRDINRKDVDLKYISKRILDYIIKEVNGDKGDIVVFRDKLSKSFIENATSEKQLIELRIWYGYSQNEITELRKKGLLLRSLKKTLLSKHSFLVESTLNAPTPTDVDFCKKIRVGSYIHQAVVLDGRVVAQIHVASEKPDFFNLSNMEELDTFGTLLAQAINNSKINMLIKDQQIELKKQKTQIQNLNEIGIALSSHMALPELLELIVTEARNITDADAGSLFIKEGDFLKFVVAQNQTLADRAKKEKKPPEKFKSFVFPINDKSIAGKVALSGEILKIDDVQNYEGFNKEVDKKMNYMTQTMLVIPLKNHEDEVIAVIQLINSIDYDSKKVVAFPDTYIDQVNSLASQAAVSIENVQLYEQLEALLEGMIEYSASAIDARDPVTSGHSRRVAFFTEELAKEVSKTQDGPYKEVKFDSNALKQIRYAAWLHDMGKIGVREYILTKQNKLTDDRLGLILERFKNFLYRTKINILETILKCGDDETKKIELEKLSSDFEVKIQDNLALIEKVNKPGFLKPEDREKLKKLSEEKFQLGDEPEVPYLTEFEYSNLSVVKGNLTPEELKNMQSHASYTKEILKQLPFPKYLQKVPDIAASHHEKLNGTGYPNKLGAEDISIESRIIAIVDIYEALTAQDRPYKPAMPVEKALQILGFEVKDNHLDKDLVDIFINNEVFKRGSE